MIPLFVAAAFALAPQPKVIVIVKPPDDVSLGDLDVITLNDRHSSRLTTEQLRALIALLDRAQCSQQESLAVWHREGGFKSGFGPLPPGALPPAPLTTAGFWSMGSARLSGGFGGGRGGMGGFGGGGTGGGRGAGGGRGGR